jgi:hypothetical protein
VFLLLLQHASGILASQGLTAAEDALYNCCDPRYSRKLIMIDTSATPACDAGSPVRLVLDV